MIYLDEIDRMQLTLDTLGLPYSKLNNCDVNCDASLYLDSDSERGSYVKYIHCTECTHWKDPKMEGQDNAISEHIHT